MSQSLLPDKTLGHLMELAFNKRKEQKWLYLRSEKLHANYPIDDFLDLQLDGYKQGDFFKIQVLPGPQTFRLIEDIDLRSVVEQNYSNHGFLSKKDEVLLIKNKKVIQSLHDVVEVSRQQRDDLISFLQSYSQQFSEKKLFGQENFDKPEYFCSDLESKLTSQDRISRKGTSNIGDDGPITDYYCHKVLYLHHSSKLKLNKMFQKRVTTLGKSESYSTAWTDMDGDRPKYLWHIVYDLLKTKDGKLPLDKATRKGLEKKWDVLKKIWEAYFASNGADCIFFPIAGLTINGRSEQLTESILDGFVKDGVFKSWKKVEHLYQINYFNHKFLPEYYKKVQEQYKAQADAYKKTQNHNLDQASQRFHVDLNTFTVTWNNEKAVWSSKSKKKVPHVLHFAKYIFDAYLISGRHGLVPNSDLHTATFSKKSSLSSKMVKQLQNQRDQLVKKLDEMFPNSRIVPSKTILWKNKSTYIEQV
jgi:hypothetical protein